MDLNPGRALARFLLQSTALRFSTLSGTFRLASLLALLIGLNLFFESNHKTRSFRVCQGVRQGSVLGPVLFSYFSSMISLLLCFLLSAALCMLTIWPFGPPPSRYLQPWRPHKELWSEYWCLSLYPKKCEAFFSVYFHQANLQPNLFLFNSWLRFNPTPTFLGVSFDRTLSFSKHVSWLKAKFFPRLKALRCISASSWGPSKESLFLLYKTFLRPLLTYASTG